MWEHFGDWPKLLYSDIWSASLKFSSRSSYAHTASYLQAFDHVASTNNGLHMPQGSSLQVGTKGNLVVQSYPCSSVQLKLTLCCHKDERSHFTHTSTGQPREGTCYGLPTLVALVPHFTMPLTSQTADISLELAIASFSMSKAAVWRSNHHYWTCQCHICLPAISN